jgi:SAM-dependent methyltransferase
MIDSTPGVPNPQERQYEWIHDAYAAHYYDPSSMAYRRKFVFEPLCAGLDLAGKRIADLACGSGHNSLLLRQMYRNLKLEGFDLSAPACADYEKNVGARAHKVDLTRPFTHEQPFDAAVIVGGLHHCVANLPATLTNIAGMLKPGGLLLMWEPSARSFLEIFRRHWYRRDRYFEASTEAALDPRKLMAASEGKFVAQRVTYHGGPAYFLIYNSLVMRVPLRWKPALSPPLFWLERAWNALPIPAAHATFMAVWERRTDAA